MSEHLQHVPALLEMSHELGKEERGHAIFGEGNTSATADENSFWVKASGTRLGTLTEQDLVLCRYEVMLSLFQHANLTDEQIEHTLLASRCGGADKKPSVESLIHAFLLTLPGVEFVGHAHSTNVNKLLCSPQARTFSNNRLFPEEVVYCGVASVLIPYLDPGLTLAVRIKDEVQFFQKRYGVNPKVILLENHGIITLGATPNSVLAAMFMADKAAQIFAGAATLGGPIFMQRDQIERIANRSDEHYRQQMLGT